MEYRLNKYISGSGYCSRREADKYIEEGHVTVDGKRATVGMRVLPGQKVRVFGELITNKTEPVYIAFNKPVGVVSTTDPGERDNIVEYISHDQRVFPIGRLDKDSQGLILLTNDGDIVNQILRVGNNHKKEYIVRVNKPITKEFLSGMAKGVPILDRVTRRCEIEEINPTTFRIVLVQGLNRQIRRMCEYFGYEVTRLERVQIMNIKLGNLKQGAWRDLTHAELEGLFDLLDGSDKVAVTKKTQGGSSKPKSKPTQKVAKEIKKTATIKAAKTAKVAKTATKPDKASGGKPKASKKPGSGLRIGKQRASKLASPKPKGRGRR